MMTLFSVSLLGADVIWEGRGGEGRGMTPFDASCLLFFSFLFFSFLFVKSIERGRRYERVERRDEMVVCGDLPISGKLKGGGGLHRCNYMLVG
jgi:hypothetical protein